MTPTPSNEGSSLRRSKRKPQAIKADQYAATAEIDDEEAIKGEKGKRKRAPAPKKKKPEQESSKQVSDEKKSDQESSKQVSDEKKSDLESSKEDFEEIAENFEEENDEQEVVDKHQSPKQRKGVAARDFSKKGADDDEGEDDCCFLGDPVPENVSRERWPHRYSMEIAGKHVSIRQTEADNVVKAKCHYLQARVDGCVYNLNDDAYVKAGDGVTDYIGRILEFFESIDHELYFTAQWFFRAEDTIIKNHSRFHDARRVFVSDEKNDNALNCIVKKIRIVRSAPKGGCPVKQKEISAFDLYYDMAFSVAYSSFTCLPSDDGIDAIATTSSLTTITTSNDSKDKLAPNVIVDQVDPDSEESTSGQKKELSLLDLFSGCGAMSTGLCLGANLAGVNLKTRWAVDMNSFACESLKFNHRDTEVRNEKADDFLAVIREWEKLCRKYGVMNESSHSPMNTSDDDEDIEQSKLSPGEFEVGKIVGICYGPTDNLKEVGLKFKVRWMGYGPSEDTWEPADGLRNCQERIKDFVQRGYKRNILPLPGAVDVICGGPPCQGMSGFNRFREKDDPFKDEKNKQMAVFIETIEYLKPKYVLMENVVDILKFSEGYLGRFAISELVKMKYQARLGILAAGNYGLPQYRMRVFLWGALPSQTLPQFPLPTHDVIIRGGSPVEFETHVVAYDGNRQRKLEKALRLSDAISDLPPVENNEARDEMSYRGPPTTEFQRYIRLSREEMMSNSPFEDKPAQNRVLYDHRPLKLNDDDYQRVCAIPKRKGSNFRDLPGVIIGPGNVAQWDSNVERVLLPSGKPLVPDYAMSFINGKSLKPFGRLWWDETVATVVTRAEPHNQIIIHPEQDRVLSIRENARLQGFPDYYKLFGPLKQRYIQVGNAVAVPVSRALGYAFGLSYLGKSDGEPSVALPQNFPIYR